MELKNRNSKTQQQQNIYRYVCHSGFFTVIENSSGIWRSICSNSLVTANILRFFENRAPGLLDSHSNGEMKSGVLQDKNSTVSPLHHYS